MKVKVGNLWNSKADLIVVTTNACINTRGRLVMGRGAALEAAEKYPELPTVAGRVVQAYPKVDGYALYGFIAVPTRDTDEPVRAKDIGLFQAKFDFKQPSNLLLIAYSAVCLRLWIERRSRLIRSVAMNYPGIGFGKLTEEQVWPFVFDLPDVVTLYKS